MIRNFVFNVVIICMTILLGLSASSAQAMENITSKLSTDLSTELSTETVDKEKQYTSKKIIHDDFQEFEYDVEQIIIKTADGTEHNFTVELADTPMKVIQGLMFRKELDNDKGMLFIFPRSRERKFWMRNTYIPLDIIYVNSDGKIHHIHHKAVPFDETPLPSNGPVQFVLEIPAGQALERGIKSGDVIYHWIFGNADAD